MSINRNSDDIDKKALSDRTGLEDLCSRELFSDSIFTILVLGLLAAYFIPIFFGFKVFAVIVVILIGLSIICVHIIKMHSYLHTSDIGTSIVNSGKEEEAVEEVDEKEEDANEDDTNLWKLDKRYYEIYRHRALEKKKLAYELRHRILDFMDFYDYVEETEYEDEADELYDRMYYDLNRTCDIIEKVDSNDRQVIDNILISTFHGLDWVFTECDNIIERMMEIYDAITADDRKVETDVLFKPVVTSSVPTIIKKEEEPAKKDPEIENLYSVRTARLFPR